MEIARLEQVSKRFGDAFRLGPLDLRISSGQILGVAGPAAAGKTTLLQLFWGFMRPDNGSVSVFGIQPHLNQPWLRRWVGYVAQTPAFHDGFSVREYLRFAGHFYEGCEETYASRLLNQFDVDPNAKIQNLSSGDRIKVSIAAAASHKPALLLLDEPTCSADDVTRLSILRFLQRLASDENTAILVSCRLENDLDCIADSILMLKDGCAIAHANPLQES